MPGNGSSPADSLASRLARISSFTVRCSCPEARRAPRARGRSAGASARDSVTCSTGRTYDGLVRPASDIGAARGLDGPVITCGDGLAIGGAPDRAVELAVTQA